MNKSKRLLAVILILALVVAGAYVLYQQLGDQFKNDSLMPAPGAEGTQTAENETQTSDNTEQTTEEQIAYAPDFTVVDADGNEVKLSDFFGKPIVLNFWASWCGPCRSEMPEFDKVYLERGEEITFLMVNMTDGSRETVEKAKAHVDENGYSFPVYYDTAYEAAVAYGVTSLPTTYFLDAAGVLTARAMGAIDRETLQRGIDMILPEEQ